MKSAKKKQIIVFKLITKSNNLLLNVTYSLLNLNFYLNLEKVQTLIYWTFEAT